MLPTTLDPGDIVSSDQNNSSDDEGDKNGKSLKFLELEAKKIEAENESLKLQIQLAQINGNNPNTNTGRTPSFQFQKPFDLGKNASLIGHFDEKDPDLFFTQFEKLATSLNWRVEYWTVLVQSKFIGKARKIYTSLSAADCKDYQTVKNSVLKAYDQVAETYREKFRNLYKGKIFTRVEFADELGRYLDKWLQGSNVSTYEDLRELILLEQLKQRVSPEIKMYLDEREITKIREAARLADTYVLTHKNPRGETRPYVKVDSHGSNPCTDSGDKRSDKGTNSRMHTYSKPGMLKDITCSFCKKYGHHISECFHPNCKHSKHYTPKENSNIQPSLNAKVCTFTSKPIPETEPISVKTSLVPNTGKPTLSMNVPHPTSNDPFQEFKFHGKVALSKTSTPTNIIILRDTASAQTILCKESVKNLESKYNGEEVILQDLTGYPVIPLAKVYLTTDLIEGDVTVAVREGPLPVEGVDMILGNDLAGSQVVPQPVVINKPVMESPTAELDKCDPSLFPVCVVTRSSSNSNPNVDYDEIVMDVGSLFSINQDGCSKMSVTKENLIQAQHDDVTPKKGIHLG